MKFLISILFITFSATCLTSIGYASNNEASPPITPTKTLLLIGDSLSSDFSIPESETWIAQINKSIQEQNPHWQLINVSMPSNTVNQANRSIDQLIEQYRPDAIALQLGNTDALRAAPVHEISSKLGKLITTIKQKEPNVIIFGSSLNQSFGENYADRFLKMHIQLASQYQTEIVPDILAKITDNPDLLENDLTHANKLGHQQIYTNLWTTLNAYLNCIEVSNSCFYQPPQPEEKAPKTGKKS